MGKRKPAETSPADDRLSIRLDLASGVRIGPGKAAVLEEIERSGSISAAGRALRMSYRRTWDLVEDLNRRLGTPVVETAAGGSGGGGAVLTPAGKAVIERYRAIEADSALVARRHLLALNRACAAGVQPCRRFGYAAGSIRREDTPMANITVPASDGSGSFSAYLVEPKTRPAGAVVLIQEVFGVNQAMRDIAAWVADLGFFAVCPDLFWRIEPGVDITDKSEAEWQKAFELFGKFDQAKGIGDLKATVAVARKLPGANGKVGTMGYCLGGRVAFMMAAQSGTDVNISYYGVGLDNVLGDLGKVTKLLVVHIGDKDEFFPPEGRAKVVEAVQGHRQIACHVYPNADHASARVGGIHWDGRSATIANGRSAESLVAALG